MSYMISVHELVRRPGEMRELHLKIAALAAMGNGIVAVGEGAPLSIDLRLESVHEGILATGEVETEASGDCSRCLEPLNLPVKVDFQELFAYSGQSDEDLLVHDNQIDMEQVVIDSVVLSLPFQPVCSEDCPGLCAECGEKLAEGREHQHEAPVDPRWSGLEGLLKKEE